MKGEKRMRKNERKRFSWQAMKKGVKFRPKFLFGETEKRFSCRSEKSFWKISLSRKGRGDGLEG